jgi:hypothetical protein
MDLRVIVLLALPLLALAVGFLLALRALSRSGTAGRRTHTADGQEILWSEPFARLVQDPSERPGSGNLIVTRSGLRFERYLSRGAHERPWSALRDVRAEARKHGGDVVFRWSGEGGGEGGETTITVREPETLMAALLELGLRS